MFRNPFEKTTIDPSDFLVLSFHFTRFSQIAQELPSERESPFIDIWDGSVNSLTSYIVHRLDVANNVIDEVSISSPPFSQTKVSPQWCRNYLTRILREMSKLNCDVIVYGDKSFLGYRLMQYWQGIIEDSAAMLSWLRWAGSPLVVAPIMVIRVLGIASISELVNLFVGLNLSVLSLKEGRKCAGCNRRAFSLCNRARVCHSGSESLDSSLTVHLWLVVDAPLSQDHRYPSRWSYWWNEIDFLADRSWSRSIPKGAITFPTSRWWQNEKS